MIAKTSNPDNVAIGVDFIGGSQSLILPSIVAPSPDSVRLHANGPGIRATISL